MPRLRANTTLIRASSGPEVHGCTNIRDIQVGSNRNNEENSRLTCADDSQTPNYFNSTLYVSYSSGDYCLIHWHGTDIAVYGARRGNHVRYLSCPHHLTNPNRRSSASARIGIYGVSVDNGDVSYYSGYASPDEFQVVLYATSGLSEGDHTIKISNENARDTDQYPSYVWMDIDYAAITGTTELTMSSLNPTATTTQTSTTPTTTSTQATTSTTSSVPPSSSSSSPAAESTSSSQSVVSTPTSQPLPSSSSSSSSSFSSVSLNAQQYSASTTIVATTTVSLSTGQAVNGPSGPVTGTSSASASKSSKAGAASDNSGSSTSKNTKLAICIPVIVISAAVIVAVGLVWYVHHFAHQRNSWGDL
ncbi:hypothetical protein M231_07223 [Tremella mesenterica]|uniref:Uncharacterized protein n=1 Tax=Tremella mesenterica TaxID=5217 RepID=A0A4Q1BFS2_TREME|nr:hypothetical protein M231_07223 [Tremella mesenterica]